MPTINSSQSLVLINKQNGLVVIPAATPLTRLNYFDGKFLRAQDLKVEQDYLRQLVRQSNQAGGPGVAHGFDLTSGAGDNINIGPGLAIDPQGRVLLMPQPISVGAQELIDKSRDLQRLFGTSTVTGDGEFDACELHSEEPPVDVHEQGNLFLIVISSAEAYCGEEDVYGKLCEEACATSTDRPYIMEGLTVRAIPLVLRTLLPNSRARSLSQIHFRSRVASAYFEDERKRVASLISKFGLEQETWCLGADGAGGSGVALGVLARAGSVTMFLDPWIARRERIDTPAKRYWQWRMMMRPWDVFIAQVLQFQCQLHDLFRRTPAPGGEVDPCSGARGVINEAATTIADLKQFYESTTQRFTALRVNLEEAITFHGGLTRLTDLNQKLVTIGGTLADAPQDEFLIRGGIVELPSAGYLPVTPGANATVNQQVRRLMGGGVDLRFCVVRPDYVAHALEEAQHMERISLLQGLDDPKNKPQVDILVPNGELIEQKQLSPGTGFEASVDLNTILFGRLTTSDFAARVQASTLNLRGAARAEKLPSGGGAFYLSCEHLFTQLRDDGAVENPVAQPGATSQPEIGAAGVRETAGTLFRSGPVLAEAISGNSILQAITLTTRAGLWMSLRCDSNLFKLNRGDNATFNARAILSSSAEKSPQFDVELDGAIGITEESITTGTSQRVKGHIENARLTFMGEKFGNTATRTSIFVDLDATIVLRAGSAIEILLDHGDTDLVLTASWDKQPLEVSAAILTKETSKLGAVSRTDLLVKADLTENAAVLSDTNSSHVQAREALQTVAKTLADPNFDDAKLRLLFPPPPKPVDELLVRGTMDWVLFHRRRTKQCALEVPPPPPAPPIRRYAVWMGVATDSEAVRVVAASLASGKPFDRERIFFTRVDVAEFEPGLSTMTSRPDDVLNDWKATDPGEQIAYDAIASATANDGDSIASGRLVRVEKSVAPVSDSTRATSDVLATVHPELVVQGTDGIIVLITLKKIQTICHQVFRAPTLDSFNKALEFFGRGEIASGIGQLKLVSLGTVLFKENSSEVSDPAALSGIKTQWDASGGGRLETVAVVSNLGHSVSLVQLDQGKAIGNAIGTSVGGPFHVETSATLPTKPVDCPIFSVVVSVPETPRIARLLLQLDTNAAGQRSFATTQPPVMSVQFNADGSLATPLTADAVGEVLRLAPKRLRRVEMGPAQAGADALEDTRLNAIFAELRAKNLLVLTPSTQVVALQTAEQPQLDLGGGATANDLIFLVR
ncbi:MAG TPA: hypothetical protein VGO56_10580 [Pyrinomonadaceae bacterium]|jgi:hypothetical protein|nr:hypothetical protein [Pyrinomonadaceae bacterium]